MSNENTKTMIIVEKETNDKLKTLKIKHQIKSVDKTIQFLIDSFINNEENPII